MDVPEDQAICIECHCAFFKKEMFPIDSNWICEFCAPIHVKDATIAKLIKHPTKCRIIGLRKIAWGILGSVALLAAYIFIVPLLVPKGGYFVVPLAIFLPFAFVIFGLIELITGKPLAVFAASWDSLPQWIRLIISFICFIVVVSIVVFLGLYFTGNLK